MVHLPRLAPQQYTSLQQAVHQLAADAKSSQVATSGVISLLPQGPGALEGAVAAACGEAGLPLVGAGARSDLLGDRWAMLQQLRSWGYPTLPALQLRREDVAPAAAALAAAAEEAEAAGLADDIVDAIQAAMYSDAGDEALTGLEVPGDMTAVLAADAALSQLQGKIVGWCGSSGLHQALAVVSLGGPDGPDALAFACGPEQVVEQALALFAAGEAGGPGTWGTGRGRPRYRYQLEGNGCSFVLVVSPCRVAGCPPQAVLVDTLNAHISFLRPCPCMHVSPPSCLISAFHPPSLPFPPSVPSLARPLLGQHHPASCPPTALACSCLPPFLNLLPSRTSCPSSSSSSSSYPQTPPWTASSWSPTSASCCAGRWWWWRGATWAPWRCCRPRWSGTAGTRRCAATSWPCWSGSS
jgi:hypothetical protein